jgi:nitrogen fixation protein FixH
MMTVTPIASPSAPPRGLTGRHVLFIAIGFFGTIASADAFLIYSAVRSWTGAETTSAYKAGQLYNRQLAEARAQTALGWRVDARIDRQGDGGARIVLEARDRLGEPLEGIAWTATLQRPTDKREDRTLTLAEGPGRVHAGVLPGIAAGQWDLVVATRPGTARSYQSKTRLVLP